VRFLIIVGHVSARSCNLPEGASAGGSIHWCCESIANCLCERGVDHRFIQPLTRLTVEGFGTSTVWVRVAPKLVLCDTAFCDWRSTIKTTLKFSVGCHLGKPPIRSALHHSSANENGMPLMPLP